ncbi:MAG TPA: ATP-binding protein, partial [Gemmatimonadaceae bacterium]|nr:ATP-binding protein [Gemmatimonadaceae bacterium]
LVRAEKLASVGRLAAGVAHEIGNPLGAINGYAHLLRRVAGDDASRSAVDGLEREAARIDRIVRGLLDYGRAHPRGEVRVDLNDTVCAVHTLLATQGVVKNVNVALDLSDGALNVRGDRHDLEQVFVNLFLNAVDAMQGTGEINVRTARVPRDRAAQAAVRRAADPERVAVARQPSSRVARWLAGTEGGEVAKIVVADAGPGVSPDLAERIFDPFVTTKDPGRGTGLGLAIVARIVENCGGTVWVEPSRAGGAAFHLLFPLDAA